MASAACCAAGEIDELASPPLGVRCIIKCHVNQRLSAFSVVGCWHADVTFTGEVFYECKRGMSFYK